MIQGDFMPISASARVSSNATIYTADLAALPQGFEPRYADPVQLFPLTGEIHRFVAFFCRFCRGLRIRGAGDVTALLLQSEQKRFDRFDPVDNFFAEFHEWNFGASGSPFISQTAFGATQRRS
ncbi:MAG TPA: hypothetical protein VGS27_20195 [Candidatus Sulfotelmatobacter sp.]|nr:hypothetical protein [Candidatus Sulfotelmatobacter sp.]